MTSDQLQEAARGIDAMAEEHEQAVELCARLVGIDVETLTDVVRKRSIVAVLAATGRQHLIGKHPTPVELSPDDQYLRALLATSMLDGMAILGRAQQIERRDASGDVS